MCDYRRGTGLVNVFIDHLYIRHVSTGNYSATDSLHNSQITTAPATFFFQPAVSLPAVPWQRFLTVEILQLHELRPSLHSFTCRTLWINSVPCLSHFGTDHVETPHFHCCSPIVALLRLLPSNGNVFTELLSRWGCCIHSRRLATGLCAKIILQRSCHFTDNRISPLYVNLRHIHCII
jgi:hypothetical protein